MKFIVSTTTLLKHITAIKGVIPSNPVVPILENFLFEIENGELSITASDLQTSIMTKLEIEAEENGSIAIPAKMLGETLKNLPEQPVTISIDEASYSIEIISDNGRYKLAGENATDFPKAPELGKTESMEIYSEILSDALGYTLFATSNDEMKPAMNGVYFHFTGGDANFVATDTHRLIRYTKNGVASEDETALIIHKKALQLLKSMLPSESTPVKLEFNPSNAIFEFAGYKMICRLIDERFPDYANVIPLNNENLVSLDRKELLSCLKRIVIYANQSTSQVKFKITGNEFLVSSEDLDFSNEASERLFCEHEGPDIEIGFNAKFLIEVLNNIHAEKAVFKLGEPSGAGLVVPDTNADDEDLLMLIMPIMLHNYV